MSPQKRKRSGMSRGFSLPELLTVMAIVGILASITLAGVSNMRSVSREKSARSLALLAQNTAYGCIMHNTTLTTPTAGAFICSSTRERWPRLPAGWSYDNTTYATDPTNRTFTFVVTNGTVIVTCTQTDCI